MGVEDTFHMRKIHATVCGKESPCSVQSMYEFVNESPSRDAWGSFVDDVSHNKVTVCDRTYTCRTVGDKSVWTADASHQDAPQSRDCHLDILAAAGYANNCNVRSTIRSQSDTCSVHNPYIQNGDTIAQMRSEERNNEMPMMLEGGWRWVAGDRH